MNRFELQTQSLLSDYLCWRLIKSGHTNLSIINKENLSKNSQLDLCLVIRQLGYEFEVKYNNEYLALAGHLQITESNYKQVLKAILFELFELESENGPIFNWGRVIGVFALTGCIVLNLYEEKRQNLIPSILEYVSLILTKNSNISFWFKENNYWVKIENFYFFIRIFIFFIQEGLIEKFNDCACILSKKDVVYTQTKESCKLFDFNELFGFGIGTVSLLAFCYIYFRRLK